MAEPQAIRSAIDDHLRRVASHLGNLDVVSRAEILRDVESHIEEALAEHAGSPPTRSDIQAVLAGMDPPESYAALGQPPARGTSRLSAVAVLAVTVLAALLCVVAMLLPARRWLEGGASHIRHNAPWTLCFVLLACQAGALACAAVGGRRTAVRLLLAAPGPALCLAAFAALALFRPGSDLRYRLCLALVLVCGAAFPLLLLALRRHGAWTTALVAGTTGALGMVAATPFALTGELPWLPFAAMAYFILVATGATIRSGAPARRP